MDYETVAAIRGIFSVVSVFQLAAQAGIKVGYKGKKIVVYYAGKIRTYEDDDLGTVGLRFQIWLRSNHPMCSGGCITPVANWAGASYNFANLIRAAGKIVSKLPDESHADFVARAAQVSLEDSLKVKSFNDLATTFMSGGTLTGVYSLPGDNHKEFANTIDPTKVYGDTFIASPLDFDWLLEGKEEPINHIRMLDQETPEDRLFAELKCLRDRLDHNTTLVALAKRHNKKPDPDLESLAMDYYKRFSKFALLPERAKRAVKGKIALKITDLVSGPVYMKEVVVRASECLHRLGLESTEENARDLALYTCFKERNLALDGLNVYYTFGKDCGMFKGYDHYQKTVGKSVSTVDKLLDIRSPNTR